MALQVSIADRLLQLAEKRRANQISQWEFEQSKRAVLGLSESSIPPAVRRLMACLIINLIVFGLALAFPAYAKMVAVALLIVVAYLMAAGFHLFSKITEAGRRGGHYSRPVDWNYGAETVAGTRRWLPRSRKRGL